jgi:hypothetical protein
MLGESIRYLFLGTFAKKPFVKLVLKMAPGNDEAMLLWISSTLNRMLYTYVLNNAECLAGDISPQATNHFRFGFGLALFHSPLQICLSSNVIA